jgi:hypothetical protein
MQEVMDSLVTPLVDNAKLTSVRIQKTGEEESEDDDE